MLNRNTTGTIANRVTALLASRRFFWFIIGFFLFESVWIAFSAVYPQAFDENFHFGLIQVYSHYWLPFLNHQPPNADVFGAVARDPSYLYHYLMSFPYRLLAQFIHSQTALVIIFRLIDVTFFTYGIVLFRRVLLKSGLSKALANLSLLLFILIPIIPQLAAQVSYDDLLFPLTAWICLMSFQVIDQIRRQSISFRTVMTLLIVAILTCLVTYAALPILAAVALFLLGYAYYKHRHHFKKLLNSFMADFKLQRVWVKILLPLLLVLAIGLLAQRDGYNLIKYHSVVPNCSTVLNVKQCSAYSVWYASYSWHQEVVTGSSSASTNIVVYSVKWLYWMWYRLFFAVNGPASGFYSNPPLPLPAIAGIIIATLSTLALFKWRKRLFRGNPYLLFLFTISAIYLVSLFIKGYSAYRYTAILVNMNGRYLIPVLLPMAVIGGMAFSIALRRMKRQKVLAAVIISVMFLQGGGILTFMIRSDQSWYWPNSSVVKVNSAAKRIATHVVVKKVKK
jgi:hypothetical protein